MSQLLLEVQGLTKSFPVKRGLFGQVRKQLQAVAGVSFDIRQGETLGLVGESGSGKTTVGRCVLRLLEPTSGMITLDGQRIDGIRRSALRPLRRKMQVVFQDPFSSLNPRMKVKAILREPLQNFALASSEAGYRQRVEELLDLVRLPRDAAERWPHEFSGGQRQRISIARALATAPELVVCDEAVSALDVSVKAQIVNLLGDLQRETGVAFLFISHDMAIVEHVAHRVAVMYLGKIVEIGPRRAVFGGPRHPYTNSLMSAVPVPDPACRPDRTALKGEVPSPINPPKGCRFHTRCPLAFERCRQEEPHLLPVGDRHMAACHLNESPDGAERVAALRPPTRECGSDTEKTEPQGGPADEIEVA